MIAREQSRTAADTASSAFTRLRGVEFQVWSPAGSPVRIEYSADFLRQVHLQSAGCDARGTVFGGCVDGGFRVVAARVDGRENDPALAGLEPVGIFAARVRGEVFLTECDLERLGKRAVALVVVGESAGFFVRETDGSIQAMQSYGEFPAPRPLNRRKRSVAPLIVAAGAVAMLASAFPLPPRARPIGLTVRADDGELRIAWNRGGRGSLEIIDGADRSAISVSPDLASVTYSPHTGEVRIELRRSDGQHEEIRFTAAENHGSRDR